MTHIKNNLNAIKNDINLFCTQFSRDPKEVQLVAVSKTFPSSVITQAVEAGHFVFGENKVQEALKKREELPTLNYQMHLIGHLQSNKVNKAVEVADMIHSVDSLDLAKKISRSCLDRGKVMPILLQVNTSLEEQKSGFDNDFSKLQETLLELKEHKGIKVQGLMTMGPMNIDEKETKRCFKDLYDLKEKLNQGGMLELKELSMGMSHDFKWAIEYGSTLLRIGSAIFGNRSYS